MKKTIISTILVLLLLNTVFLVIAIANDPIGPPQSPSKPWGPTTDLKTKTDYKYFVEVRNNPSGNKVYIFFDWGDGSTDCAGLYSVGAQASCTHQWESLGDYSISAMAKDQYTGEESDWGESLDITISKKRPRICFIAGSRITMADESYKNIEDIAVGDLVKSYDLINEEFLDAEVTRIYHHQPEEMTDHYLIINDKLGVTPNHLLYVNDELVLAGELNEGDVLASDSASGVEVTSINAVFDQVMTYHFEITPLGENYGVMVGYCYIVEDFIVYAGKWNQAAQSQQSHQQLVEQLVENYGTGYTIEDLIAYEYEFFNNQQLIQS